MKSEQAKNDLKLFKEIADVFDIKYFLVFGTCLGAIRDKDFIKDDDDIDVGVYAEDLSQLNEFFNYLEKTYRTKKYLYGDFYMRFCLLFQNRIDINMFYLIGNKRYYIKKYDNGKLFGKEYPRKFFDKLKEIDFIGTKFFVPDYTEEYLEYLYDDWKIPSRTKNSNLKTRLPR
jgi:phosphorylcholine metabolism protein LicD